MTAAAVLCLAFALLLLARRVRRLTATVERLRDTSDELRARVAVLKFEVKAQTVLRAKATEILKEYRDEILALKARVKQAESLWGPLQ